MRSLGIPTVLDRVIQQAFAQVLGTLFETDFSEHSHGYPGRSALQAVVVMEEGWRESRRHAVECDLKSFFDTVNHDRLMIALKEKVRCPRVLGLIRRYLMAGVELSDGTREATPQGGPQGGPLSPLLANIALDPLDKELECPAACRLLQIIFRRRKMQSAWPERSAGNYADTSSRDMPTTSSCW